jgi:hypothetical protein
VSQEQALSTPQGSLEASSRQVVGMKSGSLESHGTLRQLIRGGRTLPEEGPSGQQLAARLQSSSFASEQVRYHTGTAKSCMHLTVSTLLPLLESGACPHLGVWV